MSYLIQLTCQPFRDGWYLHFVRTIEGFLVIAVFTKRQGVTINVSNIYT